MIVEHPILVSISGPSMRQTVYAVQNDTGRIFRIKFKDYDISSYSTGSLKWKLPNGATGTISGEVSDGILVVDPSDILEYEGPFKCSASVNGVDSTYFNLEVVKAIDEEGWTPPPQPQPSDVTVESKSITENGTYTAPTGKAYSPVTVNVPNTYAAADEGKVVSNGALVAQRSDTVTQNDTYDTTLISSLTVNVSGGGGTSYVGELNNIAGSSSMAAWRTPPLPNPLANGGYFEVEFDLRTFPTKNTENVISLGLSSVLGTYRGTGVAHFYFMFDDAIIDPATPVGIRIMQNNVLTNLSRSVYDGTPFRIKVDKDYIYVNDVQAVATASQIANSANSLCFGSCEGTSRFCGYITHARLVGGST